MASPAFAKVIQSAPAYSQAALPDLPPTALSSDVAPQMPTAQPNVELAPLANEIGRDRGQLQKIQWAQENPYGTANNHPGKLGKLAHAFSTIGNIAGDIFAPSTMALIPGTQLNRQRSEGFLANRLNQEQEQQQQEMTQGAQERESEERTKEAPAKAASEEGLQGAQVTNLESEARDRDAATAMGPTLAAGYSHAVNEAVKAGRDPAQDPIVQHLSDAIQQIQPQRATPPGTKTVPLEVNGKPHQVLVDERTGQTIKDLGESGEKPPTVRVETPGEERGAKNDLLKAYQPTLDSAERMNVMTESYEKAIKDHDQQAMLNLLANHLGMTMGLQKGARMTKDIVNEAKQSQPWLQGMESKFDKDGYLSGVTLSPNQMRQMVALGQERYTEDVKKSRATAQYLGSKDDGPERVPGKATINFYLGKAGGDPAKAKQLAAEDGWTVK